MLKESCELFSGNKKEIGLFIGGILAGTSRTVAAEFTFFLAVPVMFGLSFIKLLKFGFNFSSSESLTLFVGCAIAFLVSLVALRALLNYVKKHDYKVFGYYRIVLGAVVILYFALA